MTQKEFDNLCPGTKLFVNGIAYGLITKVTFNSTHKRVVYVKWDNIDKETIHTIPLLADYELQYPNNSVGLEEII